MPRHQPNDKATNRCGAQMHCSAIAKIEASEPANRCPVRINEAVALADVLGVPVADLVVDPNAQRKRAVNLKRQEAEAQLQAARMRAGRPQRVSPARTPRPLPRR